ncbi:lipase family protein [Desulfogranum mediterraneum]|uniref:alpha/beta fold hydrolase n=1 Tax=Desulfogranum mediterraneum TaxID=160661 RepID=UPI0004036269|nr:alpha/beta fold hydrolase [Desulfogranum mediterraneum]
MKGDGRRQGVLLLHGLARSRYSMILLERYLLARGYRVANPGYPSRQEEIAPLAHRVIPQGLAQLRQAGVETIHAVTHSMGGILLRRYWQDRQIPGFGHAVMLAPPNRGCELVDHFSRYRWFRLWAGPAGCQLGTASDSLPNALGPVPFSTGIIAGNEPIIPFFGHLIPGENDGKVSVARARVEGMKELLVLPCSHPFIMNHRAVWAQTAHFLEHGCFCPS